MKIDILAVGVHPDDIELSCSGTLIRHIALGKVVGILDLTKGEMGTRGNAELRTKEAMASAKIIGASFRKQLDLGDCLFENTKKEQIEIIKILREHKPEIVLCNAIADRHPDHGRAAKLVADACYYSGLSKLETGQAAWRPKAVYHYIQDNFIHPDFVIDVSAQAEKKRECIMAFSSQFFDPDSKEPQTPISTPEFLEALFSKMSVWGRAINVRYAEGYTTARYPGVNDLFDLI
ncbi:MAG TPA: bacillithiol biosynthesis deacetylase BshB1 [Bacteroidia bacterium]|jgi:bacillithiol biosynthesis deacetylase BshB1|nr:bacillithiol biosynthesis deacetylase BshB1 [Bacteroidia bacterium]